MTCNDCPNQMDGKCCHQSIKPKAALMNKYDEEAFVREMQHKEMMSKQRKSWSAELNEEQANEK